jgi:GNAT superfamily N-acetyltransferase
MDLLAVLDATWPAAETTRAGPWRLRRGLGGGNRVSAATLEGPAGDPTEAEAVMRVWGQRPLFMVRPGEDALDAALAARGYTPHDASILLAGPIAGLAAPVLDATAIDCEGRLARMEEIWAAGGIGPARLAVMDRVAGPRSFLLGRLGDRPAACGFVAIAGGVAMLHALEVAPFARRQGIGARLTRAAAHWAAERGAGRLALAVTEANAPARALYAGLGLAEAARYHYRLAPEETAP